MRKPQPDANGGYASWGHCSTGMYDFCAGSRSGFVRRPSDPSQMYPAYSRGALSGARASCDVSHASSFSRRTNESSSACMKVLEFVGANCPAPRRDELREQRLVRLGHRHLQQVAVLRLLGGERRGLRGLGCAEQEAVFDGRAQLGRER